MSSMLSCQFQVNPGRSAQYWWLLLFEAMRRVDFAFDMPQHLPEHLGSYYAVNWATGEDEEGSGVSLQAAWEALQSYSVAMLEFWPLQGERFKLRVHVGRDDESERMEVALSIPVEWLLVETAPDGGAAEISAGATRVRLRAFLAALTAIYQLCGPFAATIGWERWGSQYVVGAVSGREGAEEAYGMVSQTAVAIGLSYAPRLMERPLAHDATLRMMDSLPVPWRGGWSAVALDKDAS